jgi:hypothetical protein
LSEDRLRGLRHRPKKVPDNERYVAPREASRRWGFA